MRLFVCQKGLAHFLVEPFICDIGPVTSFAVDNDTSQGKTECRKILRLSYNLNNTHLRKWLLKFLCFASLKFEYAKICVINPLKIDFPF